MNRFRMRLDRYLCALMCIGCLHGAIAREVVPYETFVYDEPLNAFIETQAAFVPVRMLGSGLSRSVDGRLEHTSLENPNDLTIDGEGRIVVADTGNDRILRFDDRGRLDLIIDENGGEDYEFDTPLGVHVDVDDRIYVADTRGARIAVFDAHGTYVRSIRKPDDPRLVDISFRPTKVTRDARGFYFVVLQGGNEGMLVLTPDGRFNGFFGANRVRLTPLQRLQRLFYTEAQIARLVTRLAPSPSNVAVGDDRLIYMATAGAREGQVRKFNTAALDLFDRRDFPSYGEGNLSLSDVAVDAVGNIYAADIQSGLIYMFDNNGDILFVFSGENDTGQNVLGLLRTPIAIDVDAGGRVYVLDRTAGLVQIFRPTIFAERVKAANELMNDGRYAEAEMLWEAVVELNVNFQRAYQGIGMAHYKNNEHRLAAAYFRRALDQERFSMAQFQIRLDWVQQYFGLIATSVTVLLFGYLFMGSLRERRREARESAAAPIREDYS